MVDSKASRGFLPAAARDSILDWYGVGGRSLPFRATRDPYAILVSEAMAQQTQAARAGEAWIRFMAAYPTAVSLAAATPAGVLRAWRGLGYNRRALNLWRAARRIVEVHGGTVPVDLDALRALPGVGPYTARAVAAIAFAMPVGAVDTNVRRVLGRIVAGDARPPAPAALQAMADAAVPADRPGDWTHAVMDLGAMVCTPRRPDCGHCPARRWCRYAARAARDSPADPDRARDNPPDSALGDAVELHQRRNPSTGQPPRAAFADTSRWLRGRIIDRLRTAPGDGWAIIDGPFGTHDGAAVAAALEALAREGLVELDGAAQTGGRRARLPVA
jgi:A/G-specific adenine glycosylase